MEIKIISKEAFRVIGKLGQGASNKGSQWIPPLWEDANSHFNEIKKLVKYDGVGKIVGMWGAMSDVNEQFFPWITEGKYLACCEVTEDAIPPENWTLWKIPAQTYAVVPCTFEKYGETFNFVLKEYFFEKGYELAGAVHEFYPQEEEGKIYLYFPISRDSQAER